VLLGGVEEITYSGEVAREWIVGRPIVFRPGCPSSDAPGLRLVDRMQEQPRRFDVHHMASKAAPCGTSEGLVGAQPVPLASQQGDTLGRLRRPFTTWSSSSVAGSVTGLARSSIGALMRIEMFTVGGAGVARACNHCTKDDNLVANPAKICGMGVLFDYFAADSDDLAASVIDRVGGPGADPAAPPPPSNTPRGRLSRLADQAQASVRPEEAPELVFDTVCAQGIDPVVQLGTLEELLTGRPYDDIAEDPRSGHSVTIGDGGERLVLTLTEGVTTALAEAGNDRLFGVAVSWSQTEEFWGEGDPELLAVFLRNLAGLARLARARDQQLYCWVCV
jgi:hypothetical protein